MVNGRSVSLGSCATAVEAAAAYARSVGEYHPPAQPSSAEGVAPRHVQVLEEEAGDEDDVEARAEGGSGEARAVGEVEEEMDAEAPAAEAEGLRLHLSSNSTGYRSVQMASTTGRGPNLRIVL